ncbi:MULTISPECIES: tyrosine-type recombinase/integrase [Sphingomonas]|uniref:tyrosine-type recombinase/integrase n=1 Tax=Sphingomonas TaxID=13687 RepID=UPI000DEF0679|nr:MULTISPECIES: site-specific integrase [Sphingomonas]
MERYSVQRLRGGYAIVWHDEAGKRHRYTLEAADRPTAEAEARAWWKRNTGAASTVGGLVAAYIDARELAGIISTARQRDAWKAMAPYWDRVDPGMIDDEMAREYVRRRSRSASTTRYELSMLAVALRWAVKQNLIEKAPDIWRPAAPERGMKHLTPQEFGKWFAEVRAEHARLYVELALATMARPSAILELTWPQIDWEHGTLNLNPPGRRQTKKRRPIVALDDDTLALLKRAREGAQSSYVVERGGKRIASIKKAFQAASERSQVHVTPYTLRHTGAVWAAERGTPMAELAQFMGHDDDRTTQKHYARFSPTYLRGVSTNLRAARNEAAAINGSSPA